MGIVVKAKQRWKRSQCDLSPGKILELQEAEAKRLLSLGVVEVYVAPRVHEPEQATAEPRTERAVARRRKGS